MAYPSNLVLETCTIDATVENGLYFPLWLTVDDRWRLVWFYLIWERGSSEAQSIGMEDIIHLHARRESYTIAVSFHAYNRIGALHLLVEFRAG